MWVLVVNMHFRRCNHSFAARLHSCSLLAIICTGLQRTKHDVVRVVHVGVSTIANRLRELAGTETGLLTCTQLRVNDLHS